MKLLELKDREWTLSDLDDGPGLLRVDNGQDLLESPPDLTGISVVRLDWPQFKLGQAFTQARLLRQRYGFEGQIRAGGAIFRDQAWHAARCGVTAFEIEDGAEDGWLESLHAYPYHYQRAVTGEAAWALRHGGSA
ncbi:DUF934 domain-containing protein [Parvularcula dongshanensis]|uniref:Uncharacterized protein (DUF934 family) n=1 Tax=Parvularcula dongshanensis TaxID=1173995 RepID=A0A840I1K7_9PROT|nr:DUF934 domain-containing protein [Parvularcula dongshanensis]MBB4658124.1 uncharacterized protein (DUF934 family) [Parvularcula dongshanensis]